MCCSCAAVRVTRAGVAAAAWAASLGLGEQPAIAAASATPSRAQASAALSGRRRGARGGLVCIGVLGEVGAAPPAAAERLEEGRRVGETAGLGLHEGDPR